MLHRTPIVTLILLILLCSLLQAQDRYAIDASQGCRGSVLADSALSPGATWTGEGWVYLIDDEAPQQLLFRTDYQPDNFSLSICEGRPAASLSLVSSVNLVAVGNTPLPLGTWAHLAACYDGDDLRVFLNGTPDGTTAGTGVPAYMPGPIFIGGGDGSEQLSGLFDEISLSDTAWYSSEFDPFIYPILGLRVRNQVVPGWDMGTDSSDLIEAWDYESLYAIINGGAEVFISHNFMYALRQYYYGQIGGHDVQLSLMMFDQGTSEDADSLYHDPLIVPPFHLIIDSIGTEARVDTGLLWDYTLQFRRDKYYVTVTLSKEWGPAVALQTALDFGAETDANILYRHQLTTALWHFDEGTGSVFSDATGNGHGGILTNLAWVEVGLPERVLYITSAELMEGNIQALEIDEDDTMRVTFSESVAPITINAGNIDDILRLSDSHSWLSGNGELGGTQWNSNRDILWVDFSLTGGIPTIIDGDTLYPNSDSLISDQGLHAGGYRFIRFEPASRIPSDNSSMLPRAVRLNPPYPTPFNATTRISFELPQQSPVTIKVWNIAGREVATLFEGTKAAGVHSISWDATNVASGVYLVSLDTGISYVVRKTVLIK